MNPDIEPRDREDIQGLVASGFARHTAAQFLLLTIEDARAARQWLTELLPRLTMCGDHRTPTRCCLGFTASGLVELGLPKAVVSGFSQEFGEGIYTEHRCRILGDLPDSPSDPRTWRWGGPNNPAVHGVLMLYAQSQAACAELVARERAALRGIAVHHVLTSLALVDRREHFGFRDGLANPSVRGLSRRTTTDLLPAGEVVLGHPDANDMVSTTPTLPRAAAPGLPTCTTDPRLSDFGKNATYLVFRQLEQDVQGFWKNIARAAVGCGLHPVDSAVEIATRMMGRAPDGTPLSTRPDGEITYANDALGKKCPLGSHIRRANPRDGLLEDPAQSLKIVSAHRILRRGRTYGVPAPADWYPPGVSVAAEEPPVGEVDPGRGLHFMCLCSDIARQFEFLQQTWLQNAKFGGLFDETDPIASAVTWSGHFTMPGKPLRRRLAELTPVIRSVGGAYFVLLGKSAMAYLATV